LSRWCLHLHASLFSSDQAQMQGGARSLSLSLICLWPSGPLSCTLWV
jgi:hypothetical protein